MNKIITEAPWIMINIDCPICSQPISVEDYRVELWDNLPKELKQKYTLELNRKNIIPVYCPNPECKPGIFLFNKKTRETIVKDPVDAEEAMVLKNKSKIAVDTIRESMVNFSTYYKGVK